MKRFLTVLMIMVMIPYVTTMAWTGRIGGGDFTGFEELAGAGGEGSQGGSLGTDGNGVAGRRYVAVEREGKVSRVPAEDFLVHVLAAQIPADFGPETLKAQAVIARTYIYREMNGAEEIPEEALDMDALSGAQMEELWGGTYQEDYSRIREAVSATSGLYLAYEGEPAEVFFCRAASGATRPGGQEHPCLRQAESPGDLLADGYLSIAVFTPEEPGPEGERHSGGGLSGCRPAPGGDPGGGAGWGRICGPDPDWSEDLLRGRGPVRPGPVLPVLLFR